MYLRNFTRIKTYQNLWYSCGQRTLASSTQEPMMVNPSCHIRLSKNGDSLGEPYPVAPSTDLKTLHFS
ncbi:hypothetical protein Hanom_Chr04g00365331 [Helianthus anomalus]